MEEEEEDPVYDWHSLPAELQSTVLYCASIPVWQAVNWCLEGNQAWRLLKSYRAVSCDMMRLVNTAVIPRLIRITGLTGTNGMYPLWKVFDHHTIPQVHSLESLRYTGSQMMFGAVLATLPALTSLDIASFLHLPPLPDPLRSRLRTLTLNGVLVGHDVSHYSALTELDVNHENQQGVEKLTRLQCLTLRGTNVDVTPLAASLVRLTLLRTAVLDLRPLVNLRVLCVRDTPLYRVELCTLTALTDLELSGVLRGAHKNITALTNLQRLCLRDCPGLDERTLSTLTALTDLTVDGYNTMHAISCVHFPNLTALACPLDKISSLRYTLRSLTLYNTSRINNCLYDLSLSALTNLTHLHTADNNVDGNSLSGLTTLTALHLPGYTGKVDHFVALTRLRHLYVPRVRIWHPTMPVLPHLTELDCGSLFADDGDLRRTHPDCNSKFHLLY